MSLPDLCVVLSFIHEREKKPPIVGGVGKNSGSSRKSPFSEHGFEPTLPSCLIGNKSCFVFPESHFHELQNWIIIYVIHRIGLKIRYYDKSTSYANHKAVIINT